MTNDHDEPVSEPPVGHVSEVLEQDIRWILFLQSTTAF
jgi:hypothetical protein